MRARQQTIRDFVRALNQSRIINGQPPIEGRYLEDARAWEFAIGEEVAIYPQAQASAFVHGAEMASGAIHPRRHAERMYKETMAR